MLNNSFNYIGTVVRNFEQDSTNDKYALIVLEVTSKTTGMQFALSVPLDNKFSRVDLTQNYLGKMVGVTGFNHSYIDKNNKYYFRQIITDLVEVSKLVTKTALGNNVHQNEQDKEEN